MGNLIRDFCWNATSNRRNCCSAANCIHPAEVALNLEVEDRRTDWYIGGGGGVERGKREPVFE